MDFHLSHCLALQNIGPSWVLYNLAALYWRIQGNHYHGLECIRRAIFFCPEDYKDVPLLNLANILYKLGRVDDAVMVTRDALAINDFEVRGKMTQNFPSNYLDFPWKLLILLLSRRLISSWVICWLPKPTWLEPSIITMRLWLNTRNTNRPWPLYALSSATWSIITVLRAWLPGQTVMRLLLVAASHVLQLHSNSSRRSSAARQKRSPTVLMSVLITSV